MKSSHWPLLLPSAVQLLEVTRHGLVCPSHMVGADTCLVQLVLIQHLCCSLHLVVGKAIEDVYTAEPKHKVDAHEDGGVRPALDSVKAAGTDYRHQVLDRPEGGGKASQTHYPGAHRHYPPGTEHLGKELRVGNEEVASQGNEAEGEDGGRAQKPCIRWHQFSGVGEGRCPRRRAKKECHRTDQPLRGWQ